MNYKEKFLKYKKKYNDNPLSLIASASSMPIIGIGLEEHISYRDILDRLPNGSGKEHILHNTHFAKLADWPNTY